MRPASLIVLGLLSGCATLARFDPPAGPPYTPLELQLSDAPDRVLEASRRALREMGFEIARAAGPELEAVRPGFEDTRDRAVLVASRDGLQIDLRTELRGDDGRWIRAERVCAEYAHVRERALAAEIQRQLGLRACNNSASKRGRHEPIPTDPT